MISWLMNQKWLPRWAAYVIPWVPAVLIIAVVACIILCSDSAKGADPSLMRLEFKLLPPGQGLTLNDGIKVRYYRLPDYLKLAEFDKELVKLRADIQDMGDINQKLKIQMETLETKLIPTLENDKDILRKRGIRLEDKWQQCEESLVKAEGGPIWPYIVGAAGVIVGAVAVGMYVECKLSCND